MGMIIRKVDSLGRIVLPADIRKEMGITPYSEVKMDFTDGMLIIKSGQKTCKLCNATYQGDDAVGVCRACIQKLKNL